MHKIRKKLIELSACENGNIDLQSKNNGIYLADILVKDNLIFDEAVSSAIRILDDLNLPSVLKSSFAKGLSYKFCQHAFLLGENNFKIFIKDNFYNTKLRDSKNILLLKYDGIFFDEYSKGLDSGEKIIINDLLSKNQKLIDQGERWARRLPIETIKIIGEDVLEMFSTEHCKSPCALEAGAILYINKILEKS